MLQLIFNGLVTGMLVALPALALSLTFSVLRFANFAIGAMLTLGAYLVYFLNAKLGMGLPAATLLGAAISALLAVAVDALVFQPLRGRSGVMLLVASMGVSLVLENLVRLLAGSSPMSYPVETARPIRWLGLRVNHEQLLSAAVSLAALVLIWLMLKHTKLGRAMLAVADNPALASVRGIEHRRVIGITWALSGALAAIAGTLIGLDTTLDPLMGWNYILPVFAAAILGGMGNPAGAVAGALCMGVIAELSTLMIPPHYRSLAAFMVLSVLLLARPAGLFGTNWVAK
jgi:branched-subunit amino acid ABC-type transport system permease component